MKIDGVSPDVPETTLRTEYGLFRCVAYEDHDGVEHLALIKGEVAGTEPVPVRVHSECLTGDVLGSRRCDCGEQLRLALARIGSSPTGVVVYLRGQEGRGIGLMNKIKAYRLQDAGLDTVEANVALGLPVDARQYRAAADILRYLGVGTVQLLTNNPDKVAGLSAAGVNVTAVQRLETRPNPDNIAYLRTKQVRLGHALGSERAGARTAAGEGHVAGSLGVLRSLRRDRPPEPVTGRPGPQVVGLGGGVGASRLWTRLADACAPEDLTIVTNVADDVWMHGLRICPDIDTVLYALSGRQDRIRGWGLEGDSFRCMQGLRRLGEEIWFNLGDFDLATHLLRTEWLQDRFPLSVVIERLAEAMQVTARVLPASDDEIRTIVQTAAGAEIGYQEYFVQRRAAEEVTAVRWAGLEASRPAPGVLDAISDADLIILGPSNPLASIMPILGVPGVADAVRSSQAPVVAVTPVVAAIPIRDEGEARRARSRAALLATIHLPHRASSIARLYADLIDVLVLDEADAGQECRTAAEVGVEVVTARTLIHLDQDAGSELTRLLLGRAANHGTMSEVGT